MDAMGMLMQSLTALNLASTVERHPSKTGSLVGKASFWQTEHLGGNGQLNIRKMGGRKNIEMKIPPEQVSRYSALTYLRISNMDK